jgi:hypothetical protein
MSPDPKEGSRAKSNAFALCRKQLRSRGAAAGETFFLSVGGERRCVVPSSSVIGFGALGRVFVSAARTPVARTAVSLRSLRSSVRRSGVPACRSSVGVAPLAQWQVINVIGFVQCGPLCSAAVEA